MVEKQNQLKFLMNDSQSLKKLEHVGNVCEAYFAAQKTWFAALIQDVDDAKQEVEIAWIGINKQEKEVKKTFITILQPTDPSTLFIGANCNSVCATNGMWFPCVIEREIVPTQEDEI